MRSSLRIVSRLPRGSGRSSFKNAWKLVAPTSGRFLSSQTTGAAFESKLWQLLPLATGIVGIGAATFTSYAAADWNAVRKDIQAVLEANSSFDGNGIGPILVRLAWHNAGTFSQFDKTGGSAGARMRFTTEGGHGANAGLRAAIDFLEPIKKKYPDISYSDLWSFASIVAIEEMGGPKIPWRPGRKDAPSDEGVTPHDRLPDAAKRQDHIRAVFYRMGFNDQEIVALAGAHTLGRCHADRSGFVGPWTRSPDTFSNDYFVTLLSNKWTPKKWKGPLQYEDPTGELMMLPADLAFIEDPTFKTWVEIYAKDEERFKKDFAAAYSKLQEIGVSFEEKKKGWW